MSPYSFCPFPFFAPSLPYPLSLQDPEETDEQKITAVIERVVRSVAESDGDAFADQIDLDRMIEATEEVAGRILFETESRDALRNGMRAGLARAAVNIGPPPLLAWESVEVKRIRVDEDKGEAKAYGRIRFKSGVKIKFRFWLIRSKDRWRLYDFESLEDGLRASVILAALSKEPRDPKKLKRLSLAMRKFQEGVSAFAEGDLERSFNAVEEARRLTDLPVMRSNFDVLEAAIRLAYGELDRAHELVDRAAEHRPGFPLFHHLKAQIFFEEGRYEECLAAERKHIEVLGDDVDAWLTIGAAHEELGNPREAALAYHKGIACDDDDFDNRFNLAVLLLGQEKNQEAAELFWASCQRAPEARTYFDSAVSELSFVKDFSAIQGRSRKYTRAHPGDSLGWYYLGRSLKELDRPDEAIRALENGAKLAPEDPDFDYELGLLHAAAEKSDKAVKHLIESCEKSESPIDYMTTAVNELEANQRYSIVPELIGAWRGKFGDDPTLHYLEGHAYRLMKEYDKAETALLAGLSEHDEAEHLSCWEELTFAVVHQNRLDEAIAYVDKVRDAVIDWPDTALLRARILALGGRTDDAVEALRHALEMAPYLAESADEDPDLASIREPAAPVLKRAQSRSEFQNEVGRLLDGEEYAAAAELSRNHLDEFEDDSDAWYRLGYSLRLLGKHEAAASALTSSLKHSPWQHSEHIWKEMAYALAGAGRHEEGLKWADRIEESGTEYASAPYVRAHIQATAGNEDKAVAELKKALETDPWRAWSVEEDEVFRDLCVRKDVQELLQKAKNE